MEEATGEVAFGEESSCNEHLNSNTMDLQTEKNKRKPSCKKRCGKGEKRQQQDKNISKRTTAQKRKLDRGNNDCDAVQTSTVCDGCGTNENINHYCIHCPGNLCDTCKNSHANVNLHKTHQVLQRSDQTIVKSLSLTKPRCREHLKDICMYCKQCKAPCCLECIASNHNGHDCVRIEDAYKQARENLSTYLEKIEKDFQPIPAKLKTKIEDREMNMQKRKHISKTYISATIKRAQLEIKNIEQRMRERINSIFAEENQDLDELEVAVNQNEIKLNDIAKKYRKLLRDATDHNVLMANVDKPDLLSIVLPELTLPTPYSLKEGSWKLIIKQHPIRNFEVEANEVLYDPKSKSESATSLNSLKIDTCIINPKVIERTVINQHESFSINKTKIAITNNNELWMVDQSSVKLYETYNGEFEGKFDIQQNECIEDLAVKDDNGIVITDSENNCISVISSKGCITKTRDITPLTPFGVHVNQSQEVILCVDTNDDVKKRCTIQVFSPDLKEVVKKIENDSFGRPLFRGFVKRLVQNGNGDYVGIEKPYSDNLTRDSSSVVCVSSDGVWRWVYKENGLNDIACDKCHNIIACCSVSVSILSSDGQLITQVMDVNGPISLTIDTTGVLWILCIEYSFNSLVINKLKYLE